MDRIHLVIADEDKTYLEMFTGYVRTSDYANRLAVKSFSQKDALDRYLNGGTQTQILLAQAGMIPDPSTFPNVECVIRLEETGSGYADASMPALYKYQPLTALLSAVFGIYAAQDGKKEVRFTGSRKSKVLSVYSAAGGCGKTTVAVNMARQLALLDYRVFYLNMELLSSAKVWIPMEGEGGHEFAQLLYYMKTNAKEIGSKLQMYKKHDVFTKADYLVPLSHVKEMMSMTMQDAETLIDILVEEASYDVIVADLEASLHERVLGVLRKSDDIVWLLLDDMQSLHKTKRLLEQLPLLGEGIGSVLQKTKFVVNRFTGAYMNPIEREGIRVSGHLPYIPQWKNAHSREQMYSAAAFNERLTEICGSLYGLNGHAGGERVS